MSNQRNCRLIYFRKYSDFCYMTENNFKIRVSENADGMTEVFVEYSGISRKAVVFQQCALNVFREVSPTDWICGNSDYLIHLYQKKKCISCKNIKNFSK